MPDYSREMIIDAPAATLFEYLAEVRHLPEYFPTMVRAEPADGDAVDTTAELHGHREDGEAWFKVDQDSLVLRWGSEGDNDYHGELSVTEHQPTSSTVKVSLHTERVASPEIDDGLEQTLINIKRLVERD